MRGARYDLLLAFIQISPMLIAIFLCGEEPSVFGLTLGNFGLSVLLGLLFGATSMTVEYYWLNARLLISEEMLRMQPKLELRLVLRRVLGLFVLFPISEEIFYRGTLQAGLTYYIGFFSIMVSTFLFFIQHFIDPIVRRYYVNRKSQILLLYEGLALGTTIYLSGSLLGCILAHMLTNLLNVLSRIRKYLYFNES